MLREVWSDSYDVYVDLWTSFVISSTINDGVRVTELEKLHRKPSCEISHHSEFTGCHWRLGN